jgi:hypothetical protein
MLTALSFVIIKAQDFGHISQISLDHPGISDDLYGTRLDSLLLIGQEPATTNKRSKNNK